MFGIDRPSVLPPSKSYRMGSLFVCDLLPRVTESALFRLFQSLGPVFSVKIIRRAETRLNNAYVNFHNFSDAERALRLFNFTKIQGQRCRIMWTQKNKSRRDVVTGNLIVKEIDPGGDLKLLYDSFAKFGSVKSLKIGRDKNGNPHDYCFVQFWEERSAKAAMQKIDGMIFEGKHLLVKPYRHGFTNIFVKNFGETVSDATLEEMCKKYGKVTSIAIPKFADGRNKGFLFCNFESHEDALKAIESLNGKIIEDSQIIAVEHKSKEEREESKSFETMQENVEELLTFTPTSGAIDIASLVELEVSAQKQMIGNYLFGAVCDMVPESAETCQGIVRVLLELDVTELLILLDSPREGLASKVSKAVQILHSVG